MLKYKSKEATESMSVALRDGEDPKFDSSGKDPSAWSTNIRLSRKGLKWTFTKTLSDLRVCTHSAKEKSI